MNLLDRLCSTGWALYEPVFDSMKSIFERHIAGDRLSVEEIEAAIGRPPETQHPKDRVYAVHNGVAIIPVRGVMAKHADQVGGLSQPRGTSSENIQRDLRTALADHEVQSILLHIESPGGSVDGTQAAANAVAEANLQKRVVAYCDGLCASAAFWLASQADAVYANETAVIGSIGVIGAMIDSKGAADKAGIKVHVLRSVPLKAPGQPGEAITDDQLKASQKIVDDMHAIFAAAVGVGRDLKGEALAAVADGRVHLAPEAKSLGMIDGISTLDQVLADLSGTKSTGRNLAAHPAPTHAGARPAAQGRQPMKIEAERLAALIAEHQSHAVMISTMAAGNAEKKQEPATEQEILAAIQAKQSESLTAKVAELSTQLTSKDAEHVKAIAGKDSEITALKAELKEAKEAVALVKPKGVTALEGSAVADPKAVSPVAAYEAKIAELKAAGDKTPSATIARKFPDINQAYITAANAQKEGAK